MVCDVFDEACRERQQLVSPGGTGEAFLQSPLLAYSRTIMLVLGGGNSDVLARSAFEHAPYANAHLVRCCCRDPQAKIGCACSTFSSA